MEEKAQQPNKEDTSSLRKEEHDDPKQLKMSSAAKAEEDTSSPRKEDNASAKAGKGAAEKEEVTLPSAEDTAVLSSLRCTAVINCFRMLSGAFRCLAKYLIRVITSEVLADAQRCFHVLSCFFL